MACWRITRKSSFDRQWDAAAKTVVDSVAAEIGMAGLLRKLTPRGYRLRRAWYRTPVARVGSLVLERWTRL